MEKIKTCVLKCYRWQHFWLVVILALNLILHLSTVMQPQEMVLDEQHYIPDALNIIEENDTLRPEHPPLGKLFLVTGIRLFGDNSNGWRFFPIMLGVASIAFFYFICRALKMPQKAVIIATFLLALENMTFVQASVAMLDIFFYVFMMLSFLLYLKGKPSLAAVAIGLSTLAKLNGALTLVVIGLYWLIQNRQRFLDFALSMLLAPLSFICLMPVCDFFIYRKFVNPVNRISVMTSTTASLTFENATHDSMSRPWEWVLLPKIMPFWYTPNYLSALSFNIWAFIFPTLGYMVYRAVKKCKASLFALCWFTGTYLVWIPASIITNRISFPYYFYPTIGALCIGLGLGLSQLLDIWQKSESRKRRWLALTLAGAFLIAHIVIFVIISPVFT